PPATPTPTVVPSAIPTGRVEAGAIQTVRHEAGAVPTARGEAGAVTETPGCEAIPRPVAPIHAAKPIDLARTLVRATKATTTKRQPGAGGDESAAGDTRDQSAERQHLLQ